jgi:hypothetical protein
MLFMNFTFWQIIGILLAVAALILGGLILFSDKFLAHMHKATWRRTGAYGDWLFSSDREASNFDRYGTGLGLFLGGLIFLTTPYLKGGV